MRIAEAIESAQAEATEHGINILVTYNPYAEEADSRERYGYHPESAKHIFKYETAVSLITPENE